MDRGVLLLTGGSGGIDAAVARSAASAGWAVCLTYHHDHAAAAAVVADVEAAGGVAVGVQADTAVDTLGVGLAREVAGDGIRVNVVRPGIIDTEIHASGGQPDRVARLRPSTPMGRAGTADEVAAAVIWLLGDN